MRLPSSRLRLPSNWTSAEFQLHVVTLPAQVGPALHPGCTAPDATAHARAVASGARIHFPPEEDRDEPGYHAFFAFDPDGIRVEVFSWTRESLR